MSMVILRADACSVRSQDAVKWSLVWMRCQCISLQNGSRSN